MRTDKNIGRREKPNQTVHSGWTKDLVKYSPRTIDQVFNVCMCVCVDVAGLYKHTVHEDMMSFKYTQAVIFLHIRQQSVLSVLGATCLNSS